MTSNMNRAARRFALGIFFASCALFFVAPAHANDDNLFYHGKTITIVVGLGAGGGYDICARLVARHLGSHIAGHPEVIVENRPGGTSKVAAGYVFRVAPQDGTVIGSFLNNIALEGAIRTGLPYEVGKFNWLGRVDDSPIFGFVSQSSPAKTVSQAKQDQVVLAASGADDHGALIPWALNRLVGTKFKVITGYRGNSGTALAMEQGEVDGMGSAGIDFLKTRKPEWLSQKKIAFLYTNDVKRNPEFPDVPTIAELVTDSDGQQVMRLIESTSTLGRAYAFGPQVPSERVEVLRQAFAAMLRDPKFLADAEHLKIPVNPMSGEEIQKLVTETANISPEMITKFKQVTAPP